MSKYVEKKHGIIIGSGNVFFYRDEDDNFHDFNAVLWLRGFAFQPITSANYFIRTPAHQFLWNVVEIEITSKVDSHRTKVNGHTPSWSARRWCDDNAPGWGCRPPQANDNNPTFFFKRRKDALGLAKFVEESLKGCPNYG